MAKIASPTATPAASHGHGSHCAQATPMAADTRWPPSSGHGCASGLLGSVYSSTAAAPIDATSNGAGPRVSAVSRPVSAMANRAAAATASCSRRPITSGSGHQRCRRRRSPAGNKARDVIILPLYLKMYLVCHFVTGRRHLAAAAALRTLYR